MKACDTNIIECLNSVHVYPKAFASGFYTGRYPDHILQYDSNSYDFSSGYGEENWVIIDFNSTIILFSYQIYAKDEIGWIYNWKTEISSDLTKWSFLDEHNNTKCGSKPTFNVKTKNPFRYLRITATGNSYDSTKPNIALIFIKFFGSYSKNNNFYYFNNNFSLISDYFHKFSLFLFCFI